MTTERVTADDLGLAATWLEEYNDGEPTEPNSDKPDEAAIVMFKVARWLRAEEARRTREARVRELTKLAAQRTGRKASDPAVKAWVKNKLAELEAGSTT